MYRQVNFIDRSIFFIFYFLLIIDSFNGFLLTNNVNISISQLVKIPLLTAMFFRIFILNRLLFIHILFIFLVLFFSVTVNYFAQSTLDFFKEFIIISKLLIVPVSAYYFVEISKLDKAVFKKKLISIFTISFFIIVLNIILGVLGFGFDQYTDGIGKKGFFYAGNELSILYVVIYSALMYLSYTKLKKTYYVALAFIGFFVGLFISTKVSMISILLLTFIIPILSTKWKINLKNFLISLMSLTSIVVALIFLTDYIVDSGLQEKWQFFLKRYDYNYVSIILSGRDIFLEDAFSMAKKYGNELHLLFGYSYQGFMNLISLNSMKLAHFIEMDFFDLYFFYGILGLLSVLSVWFYAIYYFIINKSKNYVFVFTAILILLISFLSGHVLFSGLSGPFIGLYLSQLMVKDLNFN